LPIIYVLLGLTFCIFLAIFEPLYSLWGLGIVLLGIPLYYVAIAVRK